MVNIQIFGFSGLFTTELDEHLLVLKINSFLSVVPMIKLVWLMLKEEIRLHSQRSNKLEFLLFPFINFFFVLVCCLLSPRLLEEMSLNYFYYLLNSGIFVYGIFMGAFVFFGKDYVEKQFGKVSFIISTPFHHPISFKKIFLAFFFHDVIYYFIFTITPISAALLIATPIMGFKFISVGLIILCATLSFLFGISLSFFSANLYARTTPVFLGYVGFLVLCIFVMVFGPGYTFIFPAYIFQVTKEPVYLVISLFIPVILVILSEFLIQEKPPADNDQIRIKKPYDPSKFKVFKGYSALVAKEFLDVRRSKMMSKILFSFCVPLIIISFGSFILTAGLDLAIDFNLIFYGSWVGFFGITIYSFLNFTDNMDYYQQLPITVPQVIKAKLIVFLILTLGISTIFLLVMSVITGEYIYLPMAFVVMIITSVYIAVVTAYLTGLRTNSYLFNVRILIKFNVMAILPLLMVTMTSFVMATRLFVSIISILGVCVILVLVTYIFFKKIDKKWMNESFAT